MTTAIDQRGEATERVWRALARASFAVISYATPTGAPRSSGVLYTTAGRRLYVVVATDSWKAKHINASGQVAVTVPVRRGGIMSLLLPIPPATISFHGSATVHRTASLDKLGLPERFTSLLPAQRRAVCSVIEIRPAGRFITYGIGISLVRMRDPALARAHVPVD